MPSCPPCNFLKTTSLSIRSLVQPYILKSTHLGDVNIGLETIPICQCYCTSVSFHKISVEKHIIHCHFAPSSALSFAWSFCVGEKRLKSQTFNNRVDQELKPPKWWRGWMWFFIGGCAAQFCCRLMVCLTIGSMEARYIYLHFYHKNQPNVAIFTIYGSYGLLCFFEEKTHMGSQHN